MSELKSETERILSEQVKALELIIRRLEQIDEKLWWSAAAAKMFLIPAAALLGLYALGIVFSMLS